MSLELYTRSRASVRVPRGSWSLTLGAVLVLAAACGRSEERWLEPGGAEARRLAEVNFARGLEAADGRDLGGARFWFSRALRLDPEHARAFHHLGRARFAPTNRRFHYTREPVQQAMAGRHHTRALELDPEYAEAYEGRGWVRLAQNAVRQATADFVMAAAIDTAFVRGYSDFTWSTRDPQAAIETFTEELEGKPNEALLLFKRGNARAAAGDVEGALADYEAALEARPELPLPLLARADLRIRSAEFRAAIRDLEAAAPMLEGHPVPHELLGWAHYLSGDSRAAVAALTESLRDRPVDRRTLVRRGLARYELGEWREALADFTEAHRQDPTRLFEIGVRSAEPARHEVALPRYEARLAEQGEEPVGLFLLANALHRAGRDFEAVEAFTRCLELAPDVALVHLSRGVVHERMRDEYAALADYEAALRLDPGLARAHNNRGNVRFVYGELETARTEYRRAVELAPEFPWPHRNLGLTLLESDPPAALDAFTTALELDPGFTEAWEDRARAHLALGDVPAAWQDRRRAAATREAAP